MQYNFITKRLAPTTLLSFFAFAALVLSTLPEAKAQFWTENFGVDVVNCASQGTSANNFVTANGTWIVEASGPNGPVANVWYISAAEGGVAPPGCSVSCLDAPILNRTLHVGRGAIDEGAIYAELGFNTFANTDRRAVSPIIDCSGEFTIELTFDFINNFNAADFCVLDYWDGLVWQTIFNLPNSPATCGPERTWTQTTVALPASANNNPNVRLGFRWRNNDDGITNGANTGLSVAIDQMRLFAGTPPEPPVADFTTSDPTNFCEENCITYNATPVFDEDFSTGLAGATFIWAFPGGTPATSTQQNPLVCYALPGSYSATLTVTDNIGTSNPFTINNFLTVIECGPIINISVDRSVACANEQCFNFTDLSTGDNVSSWLWTFTSASGVQTTSTLQNPANVCLNEIGFYSVSLLAFDDLGSTLRNYPNLVQVIDCTGPEVDFSASRLVVCPGECIQFTDLSTSPFPIFAWNWTFPGGQAQGSATLGSSTQQNPLVCFANPGTFTITLAAQDQEGISAITKSITIIVDPCTGPPNVGINASAREICTGDCVDFFNESLGLVEDFLWVFQGVSDINQAVSTEANPSVICYNTPGTYDVTLTGSNSFGQIDSKVFSDYIKVNQCLNPPVPRIELSQDTVCAGKCIDFTSVSTGLGISGVEWNFQGGTPSASSDPNPTICYNASGTYSVSLKVTGAGGDSTRVFTEAVTVVAGLACRPQITVFGPDTICAGDCGVFSGTFIDAVSVEWSFIGGNPATSTAENPGLICFPEVGTYPIIVEAFNVSGAATPVFRNIVVLPRPPLSAGPDRTVNAGTLVELTASIAGNNNPSGSFTWQPFDLVDNFRQPTVTTSPRETTIYIVSYQELNGCTTTDSVRVNVNFVPAVGVPSAFSPNGDGMNDDLRVLGQGIARMDFKVFNRYGQLVFETTEQSLGWDGTQNGRALNPGTFVWVLDVSFAEGLQERYTGDVTLVR